MRKERAIFAFFVIAGIFMLSLFESELGGNEKIVDYQPQEKRNETVFTSQNYLLPLEKILLPARHSDTADIDLTAKAILVIDIASGKIIYGKDADKKLPIASLTKLATALAILELSDKNMHNDWISGERMIYNLEKSIIITKSAIEQEGDSGSLEEGEIIKAKDLLSAMLIASSNDAAWALAEDAGRESREGGTISDFVELMNRMAQSEKMEATHFSNPTGIDDKENYSSAGDVLRVTQKFMRYYPEIFALTKIKKLDIKSLDGTNLHHLENTNKLLGKMPGIIGGKTGFTDEAGESLVLVVKNPVNGAIISAAIIGSKDRFREMEKLVDWVWDSYEWR